MKLGARSVCLVFGYLVLCWHWRTFGHIRHSSGMYPLIPAAPSNPLKCAHLAGESNTVAGYSTGFMPTIFVLSVMTLIFDMQCGHA